MQVQVILKEEELNEAIRAYIVKQGYPVNDMDVNINLIKGRSGAGSTRAEVELLPKADAIQRETISEKVDDMIEDVEDAVEDVIDGAFDAVGDAVESLTDKVSGLFDSNDDEDETVAEEPSTSRDSLFS